METTTFKKLCEIARKKDVRTIILQGGTSSAKTHSVLELIILLASQSKPMTLFSIVSESLPHLKRGAMRDFSQKLIEKGIYSEKNHNKTNNQYTFPNAGTVEFFGADNPDALRGGRRDFLFVNEATGISLEAFEQLSVRTKQKTFIDFNPSSRFWAHDIAEQHDDATLFISTYEWNEFLDDNIVQKILKKKPRYNEEGILISGSPNWWRVYGEGQIGSHEGIIFKENEHWRIADFSPENDTADAYGLDFGFSSDEASLCGIWRYEGGFFVKSLFYETGLNEMDYVRKFESIGIPKNAQIFCDSASPSIISTIQKNGWRNAQPTKKYAGSVNDGISTMQSQILYIGKNDVVAKMELQGYEWKKNRVGQQLDVPTGTDHFLDSVRYAISGVKTTTKTRVFSKKPLGF